MPVPEIAESFAGSVNRVTLGATKDSGGTRASTVTVGGARNVVYGGSFEDASEKPVIAMDVVDTKPDDWPEPLAEAYESVMDSPADWAKKCVEEFGAELICLKLDGIHPDKADKDAA
ncbi:MAG: acetyl-CoA decarbonylase/synthase complex subunit delta, partial [Planctomycetota bacterium]